MHFCWYTLPSATQRRTRFFDKFHKIATFLTAFSGTATLAAILAKTHPAVLLTFAFFSVVELIVNTSRQARQYIDLSRRFFALEKAIVVEEEVAAEKLTELKAARLDIEADEPPPLKVLDSICHNELLRAMGYDQKCFLKISRFQRFMANIMDIGEHKIAQPQQ